MQNLICIKVNDADRHVASFHAVDSGVLIGQMLDLLQKHPRVVQEADHVIETFGDAQDVCAELGTVHIVATDTSEQGSRLRKTFKDSARQCCSCENYFSEVFRLQNTKKTRLTS